MSEPNLDYPIPCTVELVNPGLYVTFPHDPKVGLLLVGEQEQQDFIKECQGENVPPTKITKCPISIFYRAKKRVAEWNRCPF